MPGPLEGVRILEMSGIGPGPFAGMMLADHGAEVIRVERLEARNQPVQARRADVLNRSRKSITVDLKAPGAAEIVKRLAADCDGLIEGFRPGVMERLGLGPDVLLGAQPQLVYGRMTGWGQTGPYAHLAGHDINYIALSGVLHAMGRAGQKPTPPLNLVGDFGGGGMMLAFGMVSAILNARVTGRGQVIDCAMTEGSATLMGPLWGFWQEGRWRDERGVNVLDSGAHFYDAYETSDGLYVALGAIEPPFYRRLLELCGLLDDPAWSRQWDSESWPALKDRLTDLFLTRTRAGWCDLLETEDVCFAPVQSMTEAPHHPQNQSRGTFIAVGDIIQPAPSPRFGGTVSAIPKPAGMAGAEGVEILTRAGFDGGEIDRFREDGLIG